MSNSSTDSQLQPPGGPAGRLPKRRVTVPTAAMRDAMNAAPVGDDVFGETRASTHFRNGARP